MEKRWYSLFILAAAAFGAVLLLASCGSKGLKPLPHFEIRMGQKSRSAATAVPAPQQDQDHRPVIVAFGDSLTAGVAGRSYPDNLQDLLDQHGYAYRVDNQGVSGDTSSDGLARIDNVTGEHPALVLLEFGGNDGLRGIPVDATRQNLSDMIKRLQAAKIPVVLLGITLPPNYGPDYVKPFTDMFPGLAHQYHLTYMPFLLLHVYKGRDLMQPDGIHPNGAGNKIVAQDVYALIKPMLKAVQHQALDSGWRGESGSGAKGPRGRFESRTTGSQTPCALEPALQT